MKFRPALPVFLAAAVLLSAACTPSLPDAHGLRTTSYAHPVPPGVTFDMAQGREITPARLAERLGRTRLLFLGEHHSEPRSHAFQIEMLKLLRCQGRVITVALEMFPPSANPALEAWRQGTLADEAEFLERSGWYEHWGYPWAYYRELFLLLRRHRIPTHGINAEKATRAAARKGDLSGLPAPLREEIGPLKPAPDPHAAYLLDTLRAVGHGGGMKAHSPAFRAYRRVQWLWDRLMGLRAARLAEAAVQDGIVVVLLGSGHLAHGLGANLQAARVSAVLQLTVWDDVREKAEDARHPVAAGMADLVRIYEEEPHRRGWPGMAGITLERNPSGATVKALRLSPGSPWHVLKAGDVISSLNGKTVTGVARLRLAYERLPIGSTARFAVRRGDHTLIVELAVRAQHDP